MNASELTFVLFACSLGLLLWRPANRGGKVLHLLLCTVLGFLSCIALLFSLLTLWWPPAQNWSVAWSVAALVLLAASAVSGTLRNDRFI